MRTIILTTYFYNYTIIITFKSSKKNNSVLNIGIESIIPTPPPSHQTTKPPQHTTNILTNHLWRSIGAGRLVQSKEKETKL